MFLTVDKGPMFSGKTSALISRYISYIKNCVKNPLKVYKHSFDNRKNSTHISTHDGKEIPCISITSITEIDLKKDDIIFIDEAQFFEGLFDWIKKNFNVSCKVHIAGLNSDFKQESFGDINLLSPLCSEEILHLSMCKICQNPAPFSVRKNDSTSQVLIGNEDLYYTVCSKHLH